jgi:hypothetical protein
LIYTRYGIDTGDIYTLSLQCQNGACVLSDSHDRYIAPKPPQHVATYPCSGLAQAPNGSLIARACGHDGDIAIG